MSTKVIAAALVALLLGSIAAGVYVLFFDDDEYVAPRPRDGRYANSRMRYSFEYPDDWKDVSADIKLVAPEGATILDHVVVGSFETETGLLNGTQVSVVQLGESIGADRLDLELQALDATYEQQAVTVKGKLMPPQWVELGGLRARQYIIEFPYLAGEAASAQVTTFFGDRQYTVNCQGRLSTFNEKVLPGCEQVLQSFRFR